MAPVLNWAWISSGAAAALDEVGIDRNSGKEIIAVDPRYFRPTEVETLLGDPSKAKEAVGLGSQDAIRSAR